MKRRLPKLSIVTCFLLILCVLATSCATQKKRYKGYAPCPCEKNH